MSRISQYLAVQFKLAKRNLTQIRDTPHAVAGGVAIGLVFGFTPLLGFKTILAVLIAWLFGWSKLSAALAVTFHDILLPIWPVIVRWEYQIGFYILSRPHHLPPKFSRKYFNPENFFHLKTLRVIWPTFVGSIIIAAPLGFISYFLMLEILKRANAAKLKNCTPGG